MNAPVRFTSVVCCLFLLPGILVAQQSLAQKPPPESAQHGFPAMFDLNGRKLGEGEYVQWVENDLLHVTIDYRFPDHRRIVESTSFRQEPQLVQENWSWDESTGGQTLRHFAVDFKTGKAVAEKRGAKQNKVWSNEIKSTPGRTFVGYGFVLAIKQHRERLVAGEKIKLDAVGFTPKPRVVSVAISYGGLQQMRMGPQMVKGDRFTIHPQVPAIASLFVDVKDQQIWLTPPPAIGFLRWEGPLVEASDPVIRVDLISSEHSGTAESLAATNRAAGEWKGGGR